MPTSAAEIVPPLAMPPAKVVALAQGQHRRMCDEIAPLLLMPPIKMPTSETPTPCPEIVPLLVMPPAKGRDCSDTSVCAKLPTTMPTVRRDRAAIADAAGKGRDATEL